jgi:ankyrin repeat protein
MNDSELDLVRMAVLHGDCKKLDDMIDRGLDINFRLGQDGWNLLHMALVSITDNIDIALVRYLIAKGIDVDAKDIFFWTPLHYAARSGSVEAVRCLIEAGAKLDVATDEGVTPLHLSLLEGPRNLKVSELLLEAGADPDYEQGGGSARHFGSIVADPYGSAIRDLLRRHGKPVI